MAALIFCLCYNGCQSSFTHGCPMLTGRLLLLTGLFYLSTALQAADFTPAASPASTTEWPCHNLACHYLAELQPATLMQANLSAASDAPPPERFRNLARETRNIGIMSLGIMAIIYALPESISKWDRNEITFSKVGDNWLENNRAGPVWDQDEWPVNYIGHPYFGAAYYIVARNQGLTPLESGAYSFLMSTFLWEMGIEAIAEIPSKQDIIVTPLIGSVVGEAFYVWEQRILANNSQLLGSNLLGKSTLLLLNPAGSLSRQINRALGQEKAMTSATTYLVYNPSHQRFEPGEGQVVEPGWVGLRMSVLF